MIKVLRIFFSLLVFLSISAECLSQNTVSGRIVEEKTGEPVAGAFVSLGAGPTILASGMSDVDGCFAVNAENLDGELTLSVSVLGFAPVKIRLEKRDGLLIKLKEQRLSLKASRVKADVFKEQGDTLTYSAGAFKERSDRTLGELLKRLPGITVTKSGGILYNGNYINKFYIEGMDLMGAGYGAVTNNFSLESVAGVEIYKDHQPVKALEGLEHTGRAAVNIILKENAKGTWLFSGDAAAGIHKSPLFDARAMLSRFSKDRQNLFLAKGNNVGDDVTKEIREQRYSGKSGVVLLDGGGLDSDFNSTLNPRRNLIDLPYEFWYDNVSGTATLNHLQRLRHDLQLRASVTLGAENYSESRDRIESVRFEDGGGMVIEDNSSMTDRLRMGYCRLNLEKNNKKVYLSDEVSLSGQLRDNHSRMDGRSGYEQSYDLPSLKLQNDLNATVRVNARHALKLSSLTNFIENRHNAEYSTGVIEASQSLVCRNVKSVNKASFGIRTRVADFNFTGSLDARYLARNAELSGIDSDELLASEEFNVLMLSPGVSVAMTKALGRATMRVDVPYSRVILTGDTGGAKGWPEFSPMASLTIPLTDKLEARAGFSYSLTASGPEALAKAAVMTDYRNIQVNGRVTEGDRVSANTSLRYSNHVDMFFAALSAFYSRRTSDQSRDVTYSENLTVSSQLPFSTFASSLGFGAQTTKYIGIKALVADLKVEYERGSGKDYLQGSEYDYTSDRWESTAALRTSALRWLHAETTVKWIAQRDRTFSDLTTHVLDISAGLNLYPTRRLTLASKMFFRRQWMEGTTFSNNPLVTSSVTWRLNKASVFLECRNLLGIKTLTEESVFAYRTMSTVTRLRGREFLAGVRMNF